METSGIRLFPFIAFPTLAGLLGLSLLMGLPNLTAIAKWIEPDHKHLLPYMIAVLLSISYPTGILMNYSLQFLRNLKFPQKLKFLQYFEKEDNPINAENYAKILCKDHSGIVFKELEIKYGMLVFWRLSAVAMFLVFIGCFGILADNSTVGSVGLLVSLGLLIVFYKVHKGARKRNNNFGQFIMKEMGIDSSESSQEVSQGIKGEYWYSMLGLILGLASIIGGIVLVIHGVASTTSWSSDLLGLKSELNDAAPGVILFIVGLFIVIFTKPRVKLKDSKG